MKRLLQIGALAGLLLAGCATRPTALDADWPPLGWETNARSLAPAEVKTFEPVFQDWPPLP